MGTYEVSVEHAFDASHAIRLPDGSWETMHAHTWRATATFRSRRLDEATGVVVDFLEVERALKAAAAQLSGRELNATDAFLGRSPSAERVAEHLAGLLTADLGAAAGLYRVEVTEAPGCAAAFYPAAEHGG